MTESEAREKWCAMTQIAVQGAEDMRTNRDHITGDVQHACIASDCMLWKWEDGRIDTQGKVAGDRVLKQQGCCGLSK